MFALYSVAVPPNAPVNLAVKDNNKDQVTLTWNAPDKNANNPIGSFVIEIKSSGETQFKPVGKVDGKKTTYTAKKLKAGEKYEFRVLSKNDAGVSAEAAELIEPVLVQNDLPTGSSKH